MTTDVARERDKRPAAWVVAAMEARGLDDAKCAVLSHRSPSAVLRWRNHGIDFIDWVGLLTLLALPPTWKPGDVVPDPPEGWNITEPFGPDAAGKKRKRSVH